MDNEKKAAEGGKGRKQKSTLVIFAVDVSGSMNATTEVPALQGVCVCMHLHVCVLHECTWICICYVSIMSIPMQRSGALQWEEVEVEGGHDTSPAWTLSRRL